MTASPNIVFKQEVDIHMRTLKLCMWNGLSREGVGWQSLVAVEQRLWDFP